MLEYGKFSSASDVWSFGVVLWCVPEILPNLFREIMSNGKIPYAEFIANTDVILQVLQGKRLEQPVACPDEVYSIYSPN